MEDGAGGADVRESLRGGDWTLGARVRVGLCDVRVGACVGVDVGIGAGVLALRGSSTMYMGVSRSRKSSACRR